MRLATALLVLLCGRAVAEDGLYGAASAVKAVTGPQLPSASAHDAPFTLVEYYSAGVR